MTSKLQKNNTQFVIEFERENDGRWIAEIPKLPGVLVYGDSKSEARKRVHALALRTIADKIESGRTTPISIAQLFTYEVAGN
jgi:predicted RNase H-like HicB family nuclease